MAGPLQPGVGLQQTFLEPFQPADVPAVVVVAGVVPPQVIQGRRWPLPTRSASDWTSGNKTTVVRGNSQTIQPAVIPGGNAPTLTVARRRPPAKRPGSDWNGSGSTLLQVSASGAQWIQAPTYNSGGRTPLQSAAEQKAPKPTRSRSRVLPALLYNSGGYAPELTQALRRPPATRGHSRLVVPPPSTAAVTPTTPVITAGVRRRNLSRPASRVLAGAPQYNSGGVAPVYPRSVARQKPPTKPASDWGQGFPLAVLRGGAQTVQPQFNSGGLAPLRTRGVFRRPIPALRSRLVLQPVAVPPGIAPRISIAQRRGPAKRPLSRLVVPPPSGIQVTPTTPIVLQAVQKWPLPSRPASDWTASGVTSVLRGGAQWAPAPAFNSGGIAPRLVRALQKLRSLRPASRIVVSPTPPVVVGGTPPVVSRSTQKRRPTRASARIFSPPATPAPIRGIVARGVSRKPGPVKPSHLQVAPTYNSGGLTPLRTQGVRRKPGPPKLSRWLPAPLYNSAGIKPISSQGVRRVNRHRPASRRSFTAGVPTTAKPGTTLRFYVDDQEPAAARNSGEPSQALIDSEPVKGLTSGEPSPSLTDTELPNANTRVRGQ